MARDIPDIGGPARQFRKFGDDLGGFNGLKPFQPYIVDLVTLEKLFLQTIPQEITYNPETNWVAIVAPGRNVGLYQYTGGEDTVSFTISWYANTQGKQDVVKRCKWLQALSRNNGYREKPHPIQFVFGDLFKGTKWIVYSAQYRLSLFDREAGMLPTLAYQDVVLKKISERNPTRSDILKIDT